MGNTGAEGSEVAISEAVSKTNLIGKITGLTSTRRLKSDFFELNIFD